MNSKDQTSTEKKFYHSLYFKSVERGKLVPQVEALMNCFGVTKAKAFSYLKDIIADRFNVVTRLDKKLTVNEGNELIEKLKAVGIVVNGSIIEEVVPNISRFSDKEIDLSLCPTVNELRDYLDNLCDAGRGGESAFDLLSRNFVAMA
jgi:hypothetical protein